MDVKTLSVSAAAFFSAVTWAQPRLTATSPQFSTPAVMLVKMLIMSTVKR